VLNFYAVKTKPNKKIKTIQWKHRKRILKAKKFLLTILKVHDIEL
jgi:hypothetical protein